MNTLALDSIGIDNFEVADTDFMADIEGGVDLGGTLLSASSTVGFAGAAIAATSNPVGWMYLAASVVSLGAEWHYANKD